MFGILTRLQPIVKRGLQAVNTAISRLAKPSAHGRVFGTVTDLARSKPQLIAENLLLRQQLVVLNRSVKRPRFTAAERGLFVLLASRVETWKDALLIVGIVNFKSVRLKNRRSVSYSRYENNQRSFIL